VAAYNAARARAAHAAVTNVVQDDAKRLHGRATTSAQLAAAPLWPSLPPSPIGGAWQGLAQELRRHGDHWSVWTDWYDDVLAGTPRSEAEEAAFTDIPGRLPWRAGADAVNTEIARRLAEIRRDQEPAEISDQSPTSERNRRPIATIISDLAEVASPQPALTSRGQLDAIPNRAFDLPSADDDLSTLPIRQSNLIKIILSDVPRNAPAYLWASLRSYQEELMARGVQPILPLLKDGAEIIAAAVHAPRAEDEWLEPGMCKAFDKFDENHILFVAHFPRDAEREAIYSQTPLDEERASGKELIEPFEAVAKATQDAHGEKRVTDNFVTVIERLTDLARVLATQPAASASQCQSLSRSAGFAGRSESAGQNEKALGARQPRILRTYLQLHWHDRYDYRLCGSRRALRSAIEMLSRFIH
jgi:hypothetical protein